MICIQKVILSKIERGSLNKFPLVVSQIRLTRKFYQISDSPLKFWFIVHFKLHLLSTSALLAKQGKSRISLKNLKHATSNWKSMIIENNSK